MDDRKIKAWKAEATEYANFASPRGGYKNTRWYQLFNQAFAELAYEAGKADVPQREWVGLDQDDIREIIVNLNKSEDLVSAVEAKLKEKNTIDDYDPHVGCRNWPNCEREGCGYY
jgi:hypothetical protein